MPAQLPFELYGFWRSSATYRVRVALRWKGLSAHEMPINLDTGEQNQAAFRKINPQGALPALLAPGHAPMTQSMAILEFLEECYPEPRLLPVGLYERARVRSLAALMVSDTHPLVVPRVKKYLLAAGRFDEVAWRAWQVQWFTQGLSIIEQRLSLDAQTGEFCHQDQPTLADICLLSIVKLAGTFHIHVEQIPTVDRIVKNCEALEAFKAAEPNCQVGAPS